MRNRAAMLLLLAMLAGGAAAYLAYQFLRDPVGASAIQRADPGDLVQVAVAARDLPVGHLLTAEDVRMVDWPAASVPENFSRSPAEVVGRGLLSSMTTSEPFLPTKLAVPEAGAGLAILIPEGKRAMAVRVDDVVGVAGFVVPGTRVDVVVTLDEGGNNSGGQPVTQLVLQNIQVMASGQTIQRDARGEPMTTTVVTLLVDPEQGEMLGLAATEGRIQLALRNSLDPDTVPTTGARIANLLRRPAPAPVRSTGAAPRAPAAPSRLQVEVYRGPVRSESTVGPGGL